MRPTSISSLQARLSPQPRQRLCRLSEYGVYASDLIVRVWACPLVIGTSSDLRTQSSAGPDSFRRAWRMACRLMICGSSGCSSRPARNRCSANIRFRSSVEVAEHRNKRTDSSGTPSASVAPPPLPARNRRSTDRRTRDCTCESSGRGRQRRDQAYSEQHGCRKTHRRASRVDCRVPYSAATPVLRRQARVRHAVRGKACAEFSGPIVDEPGSVRLSVGPWNRVSQFL